MLLIGSQAAKFHFPDFREPKDWDIRASTKDVTKWAIANKGLIAKHRYHDDRKLFVLLKTGESLEITFISDSGGSQKLLSANAGSPVMSVFGFDLVVASPASLMLLKRSHLIYPIKWLKNIQDYHWLKAKHLLPTVAELAAYEQIVDETKERQKISLNKSNDEFFGQSQAAVKRKYEHDDLHRATCYYDKPLFETLKNDTNKALVLKSKFDDLSHEDKIRLVREECFAIALERRVIPSMEADKECDADDAFIYALERISTTLTQGWFRDFAIENFPEIRYNDRDFVTLFKRKFNIGESNG